MKTAEYYYKKYKRFVTAVTKEEFLAVVNSMLYNAKQTGYAEAMRWRDVNEELPKNQDIVLIKTDKGCYATAYLHGENSGFIDYGLDAYNDAGNITHWRPIE